MYKGGLGVILVLLLESPWQIGFNEGDLEKCRLESAKKNTKNWFWKQKLVGWPVHTWVNDTCYSSPN
jgi:hypothetical protein